MSANPSTLNFGFVPCGQTAPSALTTTIQNNGAATTYTAQLLGAGLVVQRSSSWVALAAGGSAQITVTPQMIPVVGTTSSSFYGDTLQIVTGLGTIVDVSLNQTALGAVIAFSKGSINFGTTPPNTPVSTPLNVTNSGTAPANVTLTVNPAGSPFSMSPSSGTAAASVFLPLTATFDPTAAGAQTYNATLSVTVSPSTLLCQPLPAAITLTGTAN